MIVAWMLCRFSVPSILSHQARDEERTRQCSWGSGRGSLRQQMHCQVELNIFQGWLNREGACSVQGVTGFHGGLFTAGQPRILWC